MHVRVWPLPCELAHVTFLRATDQNDYITKPLVYHNLELAHEPGLNHKLRVIDNSIYSAIQSEEIIFILRKRRRWYCHIAMTYDNDMAQA